MCGLCGALGRVSSWEQCGEFGEAARWQLRRESVKVAARISDMLNARRIRVMAGRNGGFDIAFPTGRSEAAAGLGDVWHVLERRGIPVPDPLGSVG